MQAIISWCKSGNRKRKVRKKTFNHYKLISKFSNKLVPGYGIGFINRTKVLL